MKKLFLSASLALILMSLMAQTPPRQERQPAPPPPPEEEVDIAPPPPPPPPQDRENARFFLAYKMKERMGLSEAQTLKVLEVLKEGDETRLANREKMEKLRARAEAMLKDPRTTDADFRKAVEEHDKLKAEAQARMEETEKKLLAVLTAKQQLEWVIFKRELQRGFGRGEGRGRQGRGGE